MKAYVVIDNFNTPQGVGLSWGYAWANALSMLDVQTLDRITDLEDEGWRCVPCTIHDEEGGE